MADVITRFKLETTQYDSKLRDAAKGLQEFVRTAENGGKGFTNFSQKSIEAARALGTVASGATNLKDKVKDLVGAYNDAAKAYNKLTQEQQQSDFGKALAQSIGQLSDRIKEAKSELYGLGNAVEDVKSKSSGGLFGEGGFTGMLSVAGGNLLAQGITKLGAEIGDTIQQSIELAKQGEGIRIAFERLNRPDLLDKLKEATHGTVSEIELMKAAVKFDDFKLPVEQLGTMLEFAQKKAKDTGQSVDYMVDSIVTGLGRKSLMILDNLGLSAAQIKKEMAKTGDMTTAVANIIKEQMSEAGEYVETAADRAARAAADATNEMERLGREAQPFAEEWAKAFNEIKILGMSLLTSVFGPLAESARQIRQLLGGTSEDILIKNLPQVGSNVDDNGNYIKRPAQKGAVGFDWEKGTWKPGYSGAIYNGATGQTELPEVAVIGKTPQPKKTPKTPKGSHTLTDPEKAQAKYDQAIKDYQQALEQAAMEMKAGNITDAEEKKKELQARENLWKSIGDAREIYDSPKLEEAQRNVENEIIYFGGVVKAATDAQKSQEKAARELEAAQKKLADAENKLAEARKTGSATAVYKAQQEVDRLKGGGTRDAGTMFGNLTQSIEAEIKFDQMKVDEATLKTLLTTAIQNGLNEVTVDYAGLQSKIAQGIDIPESTWKELQNEINAKLKEIGVDKILNIDFSTGRNKQGKDTKSSDELSKINQDVSKITSGIGGIFSGIQQMGIEIPEGISEMLGVLQGITTIMTAITTILSVIEATSSVTAATSAVKAIPVVGWLMANGGVVHAEGGYKVPGNHMSGDMVPAMLNSGELVLNKAQQGNLASQLKDGEGRGGYTPSHISGEQIWIALNRYTKRTGRGEMVTWK